MKRISPKWNFVFCYLNASWLLFCLFLLFHCRRRCFKFCWAIVVAVVTSECICLCMFLYKHRSSVTSINCILICGQKLTTDFLLSRVSFILGLYILFNCLLNERKIKIKKKKFSCHLFSGLFLNLYLFRFNVFVTF